MNKVVWKDNLSEIKKSWPRFLSILLIMLLGVAFFVGIRSTSPAMIETAQQYFEQYNLPDGKIQSTLGLTQEDVDLLKALDLEVDPLKTVETVLQPLAERVKVYPLTNKGYFYVVEGRLPNADNEIALDIKYLNSVKIGDTIELEQVEVAPLKGEVARKGTQGPYLRQTTFIVSGFVNTPLYYSRISRGVGNINGYVLINSSAIEGDIFTEVLYWQKEAHQYQAYSLEYNTLLNNTQAKLEDAFQSRPEIRLAQLKDLLQQEVDKGQQELQDGYEELESAEKELMIAKKELKEARVDYEKGVKELAEGRKAYESGLAELQGGESEYQAGVAELETNIVTLNENEATYQNGLNQYHEGEIQFNTEMAKAQATIDENEAKLIVAQQELETAKMQLDSGWEAYHEGEQKLMDAQLQMIDELKIALPGLENELEVLKEQVRQDELNLENVEQFIAVLTNQPDASLTMWREQLIDLAKNRKGLADQIAQARDQIESVNTEATQIQLEIERLTQEQNDLSNEQQSIVEMQQQLEESLLTQQIVVEEARTTVTQANENRDHLAQQVLTLEVDTTEYLNAKIQLEEAEMIATTAQTNLVEQERVLKDIKVQSDQNEQRLNDIAEQQLENNTRLVDLTNQLTTIKVQQEFFNELLSPEVAQQLEQLLENEIELTHKLEQLVTGIEQLTKARQELAQSRQALIDGQLAYELGLREYQSGLTALEAGKSELEVNRQQAQQVLDTSWNELQSARQQLDDGWLQIEKGRRTLAQALNDLESGRIELDEAKKLLDDGEKELKEGLKRLEDGEKEYDDSLKKFEKEKIDALAELKAAEDELVKAQVQIDELKAPIYFFNLRDSFDSYESLYDNANQIKQISTVFPVFFFAIAVLVTFTTIKRMVSEQRNYMGTMKQMGYPNHVILSKFVLYAFLATIIGTLIGIEIGYRIFPPVIMNAYNNLFHFDTPIIIRSNELNAIVAVIALGCALIPAIWSPLSILRAEPAKLLKPEPPKAGKKILIERIQWIWNQLSFNRKMTVRNIFRYKARNFMTLIGVAGCTMLIVTGYGISDTIDDLVQIQFSQIQHYDAMVYLREDIEPDKVIQLTQNITGHQGIEATLPLKMESWQTDSDVAVQSVSVIVPLAEYQEFLNLHERDTPNLAIDLFNEAGAVISERLAEYVDVTVGDNLRLVNDDGRFVEIPISKITENYIGHYVYMSPKNYQEIFSEVANQNAFLITYQNNADLSVIENRLSSDEDVLSVLSLDSVEDNVQETMGSLGVITLVLILSAAALAFVVLYNLTNINVSERMRELSTIKVLGFYNREVSLYIYDEVLILTIVGAIIGLGLGTILNQFILKTIQMPNLLFYPNIKWQSMVISTVMTLIFASVVMLVMHQKLKKIDMVEALKAVE